jgi:transcriptional regulator with XRE-family HTH domain
MATKLGEKIRSSRTQKKLSLEALAKSAGLSKSYLWELENRESPNPSAEKLQSIAEILEVEVTFLLDDAVSEPQELHEDKKFFRNYAKLDPEAKGQLRKILDALKK